MPNSTPSSRVHALALILLAALSLLLSGCNLGGVIANAGTSAEPKKVAIAAEYKGLDGKSTAVVVAADEYTLFEHPGAPLAVCRAVGRQLSMDIKGITLADPKKVSKFQYDNPYWATMRNSELLKALDVQRIVLVDITEYGTHEPGNASVWRGVVVANVSVAEADGATPDDFAYHKLVDASYPQNQPLGVLDSDEKTIQLGMLDVFSQKVSNLFHDHKGVPVK